MEVRSQPREKALPAAASGIAKVDWGAVSTWLLGFGLVAYLGLEGGGYDPLVHDQVGIAAWWILLATVAVGAIPRQRIGRPAWTALALLAGFAAWTALSLGWTESGEKTFADLARLTTYVGIFALAVFHRGRRGAAQMVGALAAAIVLIGTVALLSRLHPAWFPDANQTGRFLEIGQERLSYPLNYWNALAALIAIGLPLLLQVATCARSIALRALAAAAMPALMLTALFTLSRGPIAATFLAFAVFLAFSSDRLPKLLTLAVSGGGGAILVAAALQRDELRHGLENAAAHSQGDSLLWIALAVCIAVGLIQAAISVALARGLRPAWTRVSRRHSLVAVAVAAVAALIALAALNAPNRAANAWDEFKLAEVPGKGTERLGKATGESRYQFWSSTIREMQSEPLTGTGSGTFEYWWTRDGDTGDVVRDAHSLYMQTLGELGIVGVLILAGFVIAVLLGGARATLRAGPRQPQLAAALAGCVVFFSTAIFDWMWQMPVVTIAMLLLAAVLLSGDEDGGEERALPFPPPARAGFALVAVAAIVAIAIPLASTSLVRQSQAEATDGDIGAALEAARSAQNAQPGAASPRLQQALLFETAGDLTAAAAAAHAATERESTNWRTWLVLARIEAQRGRAGAAVEHYRRSRALNPLATPFQQ